MMIKSNNDSLVCYYLVAQLVQHCTCVSPVKHKSW